MKLSLLVASLGLALLSSSCIFSIGGGSTCRECAGTHFVSGSGTRIDGSGRRAMETRPVEAFTRLEIRGSADAELRLGGEGFSLEVEADDNLLTRVRTRVIDGVLVVDLEPGSYKLRTSPRIVARAPSLEGVVIAGSGDVRVEGLAGERFEGVIRGSGDLFLAGRVERAELVIEGSGDIDAFALEARDVRARIAGSGDLDVFAGESLDAEVRGSGDLRYRGDAKEVRTRVLGSGAVKRG